MTKCSPGTHPEVTKHERHTRETMWEPAEYEVWYTCDECGAKLDPSDLSGDEIIYE